jgi:hypothetical protein
MPRANPAIVNDPFAWRLAFVYAAFFGTTGWYLPFFPVWLAARGLDPAAIGIVLAAIPLVGSSERRRHARGRPYGSPKGAVHRRDGPRRRGLVGRPRGCDILATVILLGLRRPAGTVPMRSGLGLRGARPVRL